MCCMIPCVVRCAVDPPMSVSILINNNAKKQQQQQQQLTIDPSNHPYICVTAAHYLYIGIIHH